MKKLLLLVSITLLSCSSEDNQPIDNTPTPQTGNIVKVYTDYLDQRMLNIGFSDSPNGGMTMYGSPIHPVMDVYIQEFDLDELSERGNAVRNGNYFIIRHKPQGVLTSFCRIRVVGDNVGGTHVYEYEDKEIGDIQIALEITGLNE